MRGPLLPQHPHMSAGTLLQVRQVGMLEAGPDACLPTAVVDLDHGLEAHLLRGNERVLLLHRAVRLMAQLGRPLDEVLAMGRAVARRRDPAPELDKLERAARGETETRP
jgi:hypothetical protein